MATAKPLRDMKYHFNVLFGCGSNKHNQVLLHSDDYAAALVNNAVDAQEMKEIVLVCNHDGAM
jgi:hypothetical protein